MYHKNLWNNNRWCWKFTFSYANVHLTKYSSNYSETTGSLWFYSKDKITDFNSGIANTDNFKLYKAKLLGNTVAQPAPNAANGILKYVTIAVPLKHLSNFWRPLEMLLINCK